MAGEQDYPQATLYMVATPIGNTADISLRALHVLDLADRVACEDTRHTAQLLHVFGLHKPLLPLHQHNEHSASAKVLEHLQSGERVVYVSDAGTPGVSDPGALLAHAVRSQGFRVMPLPGASSITTLLSATGMPSAGDDWATQGFVFMGFLPAKGQARQAAIEALTHHRQAVIWMEAPHRLDKLASELHALGNRALTVGRELTKRFEHIVTLPCQSLGDWLASQAEHRKGEFVFALEPATGEAPAMDAQVTRVLDLLLAELPIKGACRVAAGITGLSKNALYDLALSRKGAAGQNA